MTAETGTRVVYHLIGGTTLDHVHEGDRESTLALLRRAMEAGTAIALKPRADDGVHLVVPVRSIAYVTVQ